MPNLRLPVDHTLPTPDKTLTSHPPQHHGGDQRTRRTWKEPMMAKATDVLYTVLSVPSGS